MSDAGSGSDFSDSSTDSDSDLIVSDWSTSDEESRTKPQAVNEPVMRFVDNSVRKVYKIHNKHQMCYIFDYITPARQWKHGTDYTEQHPWAEYGPAPWSGLVESEDEYELQPYYPRKVE